MVKVTHNTTNCRKCVDHCRRAGEKENRPPKMTDFCLIEGGGQGHEYVLNYTKFGMQYLLLQYHDATICSHDIKSTWTCCRGDK